jgi:hypothetical protein
MGISWHNWLVLGPESSTIFCLVLFRITRLQYTHKNILRTGILSESPQYRHFLAQPALFGFRVYKYFLFFLNIWDYKTSRDFQKYFESLETLNPKQACCVKEYPYWELFADPLFFFQKSPEAL